MRIDFNLSQAEAKKFRMACEAVIRNVGSGTKAAVTEAGVSIMKESLMQVPVDTGTLRDSAYLGISRRDDVAGYRYGAVMGYGTPEGLAGHTGLNNKKTIRATDPGGPYMWNAQGEVLKSAPSRTFSVQVDAPMDWYIVPNNGVNSKNGLQASTYAGRVHEDLDMPHPNGGKAKFLEDPVREWASGRFARTAVTYWARAISTASRYSYTRYNRSTRAREIRFSKYPSYINRTTFVQRGSSVQRGGEHVRKGASSK